MGKELLNKKARNPGIFVSSWLKNLDESQRISVISLDKKQGNGVGDLDCLQDSIIDERAD